jgi:hypothetical protein
MTIQVPIWVISVLFGVILAVITAFAGAKILKKRRILWLVGRYKGGKFPLVAWDFQGIYTEKAAAIAACEDETWFIGQVEADKPLPKETENMPQVEYPLAKVRV